MQCGASAQLTGVKPGPHNRGFRTLATEWRGLPLSAMQRVTSLSSGGQSIVRIRYTSPAANGISRRGLRDKIVIPWDTSMGDDRESSF